MNRARAFTLIELLVVIIVLGLTVCLLVPYGCEDSHHPAAQNDVTPPVDAPGAGPPITIDFSRDSFVAAADDQLWVIIPAESPKYRIFHRHAEVPDDQLWAATETDHSIVAAGAFGQSLWIVEDGGLVKRYQYHPHAVTRQDRYAHKVRDPLPLGGNALQDMVIGHAGPVALTHRLLNPTDPSEDQPAPPTPNEADDPQSDTWALWWFLRDRWTRVSLPPDLPHDARLRLGMIEPQAQRIVLIIAADNAPLRLYTQTMSPPALSTGSATDPTNTDIVATDPPTPDPPPPGWSSVQFDLPLRHDAQLTADQEHQLIIAQGEPSSPDAIRLTLLRDGAAHDLGAIRDPAIADARWYITPFNREQAIVFVDPDGGLRWTRYNTKQSIADLPSPVPLTVVDPPVSFNEVMDAIWFGAMIIAMMILFAAWRQGPKSLRAELPPDVVPAELMRRVTAAIVDQFVGNTIAVVVFRPDLDALQQWILEPQVDDTMIFVGKAVAVFVIYSTILELINGMTVGKWLLKCQVTDIQGNRPKAWQILLRNASKILDLIVQPMLIMMLISPNRQRLGDLAAGTVVIRRIPQPTP